MARATARWVLRQPGWPRNNNDRPSLMKRKGARSATSLASLVGWQARSKTPTAGRAGGDETVAGDDLSGPSHLEEVAVDLDPAAHRLAEALRRDRVADVVPGDQRDGHVDPAGFLVGGVEAPPGQRPEERPLGRQPQ